MQIICIILQMPEWQYMFNNNSIVISRYYCSIGHSNERLFTHLIYAHLMCNFDTGLLNNKLTLKFSFWKIKYSRRFNNLCDFYFKYFLFENFNISESNIISVKAAIQQEGVAQVAKTRLGPLSIFSHIQLMLVITNPNSFTNNEGKACTTYLKKLPVALYLLLRGIVLIFQFLKIFLDTTFLFFNINHICILMFIQANLRIHQS